MPSETQTIRPQIVMRFPLSQSQQGIYYACVTSSDTPANYQNPVLFDLPSELDLEKVKIADEETDEVCENCGRHMVIKYGPHGKFLACPGFPECHNTKPYYEKIGVACPKCGKDIVVRKTKKGRKYYGCMGNPECDFMSWQKPSDKKCPRCGGMMVEKGNKLVCEDRECGYMENRPEE